MSKVIERKLEVYRIRLICDCGGEMKRPQPVGVEFIPVDLHRCDKCSKIERTNGTYYPYKDYRELEDLSKK